MTSTPLLERQSLVVQTAGLGKRFEARAALEGGFYFAILPLPIGVGFLCSARQAIPKVAVKRIGDRLPAGDVDVALVTAVVAAWAAAALGLDAWRTRTREI